MTRPAASRASIGVVVSAACAIVTVLVGAVAGAQPTAGDTSLLPPNGFLTGWKKTGSPRVFTSADLYGHINGGAEVFLELGFERLTVQRYDGGEAALRVELYRMTDATAARGIYLSRRGKESPDPSLDARHTVNPHQLLLQQERFFLVINNLAGGAASTAAVVKAAAAAAAALPADVPVEVLQLLPKTGLVEGSERLVRGPFGLQAIYTLGEGDLLQLAGRIPAVSGQYRTSPASAYTLIMADYPTTSAAEQALGHIRANFDALITPIRTERTRLVFRDYEKKFGVVSVSGRRLEIRVGLERPPQ